MVSDTNEDRPLREHSEHHLFRLRDQLIREAKDEQRRLSNDSSSASELRMNKINSDIAEIDKEIEAKHRDSRMQREQKERGEARAVGTLAAPITIKYGEIRNMSNSELRSLKRTLRDIINEIDNTLQRRGTA